MATFRTLRSVRLFQVMICLVAFSLAWLQISPAYGLNSSLRRETARQEAWHLAHLPHVQLPAGLTQTPDAALQKKIAMRQAAAQKPRPVADVRPLSAAEMGHFLGRGSLRNPYFAGSPMPWHRTFHDVNMCDGNLFKSFTDVQVAPARGAGLVLQRTYNSNDGRVGPFGIGWTHAYDIRIQEAADVQAQTGNSSALPPAAAGSSAAATTVNEVPRTDFFGAKQVYHRDADGLYSPPPYLFDELNSGYGKFIVNGPAQVMSDTDKGMDGTIKHYTNVVTKADGTSGDERACDYIQDRYNNKTTLTYGQSYVQPDGSTRSILTRVTDPTGRTLTFQWTNFGTAGAPVYRITEVDAPTDPATGNRVYRVVYAYYGASDASAGGAAYQLKSVTLDPDGLNRTTTYTYVSVTNYDPYNSGQTVTDNGLLQSIADPLGNVTSYQYADTSRVGTIEAYDPTVLWVVSLSEPASGGPHVWYFFWEYSLSMVADSNQGYTGNFSNGASPDGYNNGANVGIDDYRRATVTRPSEATTSVPAGFDDTYDNSNNVTDHTEFVYWDNPNNQASSHIQVNQVQHYSYGQHGNLLTTTNTGYSPVQSTTYYNASQYFQQASATDLNGHTTAMGVGTSTAGNAGDADTNIGDRGQTLWVQDAGYNDSVSPSYHKQFTYTYNVYGQKLTETNLNGVVTQYTYGTSGTDLGNLITVVQDLGTGHLNRTTSMHYDVMGRVLSSTDPSGQISSFTYNTLGQPKTVVTPAKGSSPAETISYAYDGNGRTHSVADNRGTTTITYETGNDRVSSVTDPITGTTSYTYYACGVRKTMTLPGGGTWTYYYDGPTCDMPKDDPNSVSMSLIKIVDDQGRTVEFSRYNFDSYVTPTTVGVYDAGNVYDHHLRRVKTNETYDTNHALVSYLLTTYGLDSTPTGDVNAPPYHYTSHTHSWTSQVQTTWHWQDAAGQHARLVSQNTYGYDNAGNRLSNAVVAALPNANGTPQYTGGTPTYDGSGNVTNLVTSSRTEAYTYDALNRLSTVDYGDGQTQSYGFDPMGNRLTKTDTAGTTTTTAGYAYDAANRLTSTAKNGGGASAVTSDADGNTLTDTGGRSMTWDSQNRMTSCAFNGTTSTFTYGADGLRRSSTVNGVTTYYVYDGQTLIREMHKNVQTGALYSTATYLTGPRGPEYRRDDTATELDSQGRTVSKCRWYVYDGLGSVVGEVDPSGNLTSSPKYDVYGLVRSNAGTASSAMGFVGGQGHLSEANTGLIYMRARYYDPSLGRFSSEDPAKKGRNWFAYCDNNPVNEVDRTGKDGDIISTVGSADISATMDGIGGDMGLQLEGEVQDLSGYLNNDAAYDVKMIENAKGVTSDGDWGYYAKQMAGAPGQLLKAWVRWNAQEAIYDYYLDADADEVFDHATPYVGTIY